MAPDPLALTIHSAADVRPVTSAVRQAAFDGVPAAVIQVDAAVLEGITLQVGATLTAPLMDLTLKGAGVLRKSHVSLRGSTVRVEGLTFAGSPSTGDALQVTARDHIALQDVAFVGQNARTSPRNRRRGSKAGGRSLALWAEGPETTATLHGLVVADTTVTPAVTFGGKPHGRFAELQLSDAVFAGAQAPVVHVEAAVGLSLDGVSADDPSTAISTVSPAIVVLGDVSALTESGSALPRARSLATEETP
jgi:hypothetical protein